MPDPPPGPAVGHHGAGEFPRSGDRVLLAGTAIALVPFAVAMVAAARSGWGPSSDQAIELLRMHDVGSRHTPLVGPYSRLGWSHPGPLLYWIGSPALRLFGPSGVLVLFGALNAGWFTTTVLAARRVGGTTFAGVLLVAGTVMVHTHGPTKLVDPWNPWVTLLPLLCALCCAAAFAQTGVRWALGVAVVAGSLAAQSHLSAAPILLLGVLLAGIWYWLEHRERGLDRPALVVAGALTVLLWSGPLVQQLSSDDGNIKAIAAHLFSGDEAPEPISRGLSVAASQFGLRPVWTGPPEASLPFATFDVATWTIIVLPGTLAVLLVAGLRQRRLGTVRRSAFSLLLVIPSIVIVTRIAGGFFPYVLRWTWAVAVLATSTALFETSRLLARWWSPPMRTRACAMAVAMLLVAAVSLQSTADLVQGPIEPSPVTDRGARETAASIRSAVPLGSYRVDWFDKRGFSAAPIGAATTLVRAGYDLDFPVREARTVGAFRATGRTDLPGLVIVGSSAQPAWEPPARSRVVARWDPLDDPERRDLSRLSRSIRTDAGRAKDAVILAGDDGEATALIDDGAERDEVAALAALQVDGEAYETWLVPALS